MGRSYGEEILARRRAAGLTRRALADIAGVSYSTIQRIETRPDYRPTQKTKDRLNKALPADPTVTSRKTAGINILPENYLTSIAPSIALMSSILPKERFAGILPTVDLMSSILPKDLFAGILPTVDLMSSILPKDLFAGILPNIDAISSILRKDLSAGGVPTFASAIAKLHYSSVVDTTLSSDAVIAVLRAKGQPFGSATPEIVRLVTEQLGVSESQNPSDDYYTDLAGAAEQTLREADPALVLAQIRENNPETAEMIEQAALAVEFNFTNREHAIAFATGIYIVFFWIWRVFVNSVPVVAATDDTRKELGPIQETVEKWLD